MTLNQNLTVPAFDQGQPVLVQQFPLDILGLRRQLTVITKARDDRNDPQRAVFFAIDDAVHRGFYAAEFTQAEKGSVLAFAVRKLGLAVHAEDQPQDS